MIANTTNAKDIVSAFLPLSGLIYGYLMVITPYTAAKRVYKFDDKVIKSPVLELVVANGTATLSLALAELLLSFTDTNSNKAVAIATQEPPFSSTILPRRQPLPNCFFNSTTCSRYW